MYSVITVDQINHDVYARFFFENKFLKYDLNPSRNPNIAKNSTLDAVYGSINPDGENRRILIMLYKNASIPVPKHTKKHSVRWKNVIPSVFMSKLLLSIIPCGIAV